MTKHEEGGGNFMAGMLMGAVLAGGSVFFLGTKKGKEMQKKLRAQFPEAAEKVDEVLKNIKDNVEDARDAAGEKLNDVSEKVSDLADAPRKFFSKPDEK